MNNRRIDFRRARGLAAALFVVASMTAPAAAGLLVGPSSASAAIPNPLATPEEDAVETLALRLVAAPEVKKVKAALRPQLAADPVAQTPEGQAGLDRALDEWTLSLAIREANRDVARPMVASAVDNTPRTWMGRTFPGSAVAVENPDNIDRQSFIDGSSSYEIKGRFAHSPSAQLSFDLRTMPDDLSGMGRDVGALTSRDMHIEPDGSFVVTVDPRPAAGLRNHIQSAPGLLTLDYRDSMSDWSQTPTALTIRKVAGPDSPPPTYEELVRRMAHDLPAYLNFWQHFKDGFLNDPPPNTFVGPIAREGGWGFNGGGKFKLDDDEALVITTSDGGADYTGAQISDVWTLSPDPASRVVSLNKVQAHRNPDGTYTYVFAVRDPGAPNWIDTAGMHQGWYLFRWQGLSPDAGPGLVRSTRVVKLSDLRDALPPGTPTVDAAQRAEQIKERKAGYARRTANPID